MTDEAVKTIDVTPTWQATLPVLLALLERGDKVGREFALAELNRMAMIMDRMRPTDLVSRF
jgi:hypothetical protein